MTPLRPTDAPARPLGVAVVGYSFMGKAHSHAWRNLAAFFPDAPPVAQRVLVGRDPEGVASAAAAYGWEEAATDWRQVLERSDVDLVDVCVPGHLHAEVARAALAAGKHVLVEKPLANDDAQAEAMVAAARDARARGVRSMVGFNYRRVPALALARELVAEGRLGTLRHARLSYLQDWLRDAGAPMTWRLRRESAGSGVIGDLASHAVDQLHFLTGQRVTSVAGSTRTFVPERPGPRGPEQVTVEDAAWATLGTDAGLVASLEVSRVATGRKNGLEIELFGSEGSLRFDLERLNELVVTTAHDAGGSTRTSGGTRVVVTEPDHPSLGAWWPPGHVLGWDHTFVMQAAELTTAIAEGRDPAPSFEDGLAVQRVLTAVEDSAAQEGRVVRLGDVPARLGA